MLLQETGLPIKLRPAIQTDKPFIKSSWVHSFMHSPVTSCIRKSIYKKFQGDLVDELIASSITMILCHEELEDEIFAFCSYRKMSSNIVIDYIYTKDAYRKMGMASILIQRILKDYDQEKPVFFTHLRFKNPARMTNINFVYNPYLLRSVS